MFIRISLMEDSVREGPIRFRRVFDHQGGAPGQIQDIIMAEREGFEPSEELPPHTISNRAD